MCDQTQLELMTITTMSVLIACLLFHCTFHPGVLQSSTQFHSNRENQVRCITNSTLEMMKMKATLFSESECLENKTISEIRDIDTTIKQLKNSTTSMESNFDDYKKLFALSSSSSSEPVRTRRNLMPISTFDLVTFTENWRTRSS